MEYLLLSRRGLFRELLLLPVRSEGSGQRQEDSVAGSHALNLAISIFTVGEAQNPARFCKIKVTPTENIRPTEWESLLVRPVLGCLGLIRIETGSAREGSPAIEWARRPLLTLAMLCRGLSGHHNRCDSGGHL